MKNRLPFFSLVALPFVLCACDDDDDDHFVTRDGGLETFEDPDAQVTEWPFDEVQVKLGSSDELRSVHLNSLPFADFAGHKKVGDDLTFEQVTRRGVSFLEILNRSSVDHSYDDKPMNCIARDGYDPLRTRLKKDASLLPTVGFMRESAYVYRCSPGSKDPLYPEMEKKSLCVDFNLTEESQIPENLGKTWADLSKHWWQMVETIDQDTKGIFEIDPQL